MPAISAAAAAIGCTVVISKIMRCSDEGSLMADALSKLATGRFWSSAGRSRGFDLPVDPLPVPAVLQQWVQGPSSDFGLAAEILLELSVVTELLGYSI